MSPKVFSLQLCDPGSHLIYGSFSSSRRCESVPQSVSRLAQPFLQAGSREQHRQTILHAIRSNYAMYATWAESVSASLKRAMCCCGFIWFYCIVMCIVVKAFHFTVKRLCVSCVCPAVNINMKELLSALVSFIQKLKNWSQISMSDRLLCCSVSLLTLLA